MKTVLITGANKGLGYETAKELAKLGYYIFLGCRNKVLGAEAVSKLQSEGHPLVELVIIDVSDAASVSAAALYLSGRINTLDVLVNNAGISGNGNQTPSLVDDELLKRVFETNFFGAVRVIKAFMGLLKRSTAPRIVNVTSDLGSLTLHNDHNWEHYHVKTAAYGPSKTALNAYTVALAYELRRSSFKVNAVNPGFTSTDFNNGAGTRTVQHSAKIIVEYATLDPTGPTGLYVSDTGITPW